MDSISVTPENPGQVIACLGLMELAEHICGATVAHFNHNDSEGTSFCIQAANCKTPVSDALRFLAEATVEEIAPKNWTPKTKKSVTDSEITSSKYKRSITYPGPIPNSPHALPIRLRSKTSDQVLYIGHWADSSGRETLKLYSGNRSAAKIANDMIGGSHSKGVTTSGIQQLHQEHPDKIVQSPLDVLTPMAGSFNFDPRGSWLSIDTGYSPDKQGHLVSSSPVVEILAAVGLEHSRPCIAPSHHFCYYVWMDPVHTALARYLLFSKFAAFGQLQFVAKVAMTGKNKRLTYGVREE